ncbi:MAG: hypothetical protein L7F78_09680 [Syntrophales bacterium LBB04]|nr:hypothetical protein [Syntrophales bacterium LBB04]
MVWKPLKKNTVPEFEAWITKMKYDPYLYDPFLQSLDWVKDLTKAIKKVAPLVGYGNEIEYRFWDALHTWEFILNCLSIARATGTFPLNDEKVSWRKAFVQFRAWVDSLLNYPEFKELIYSGSDFFWDMLQFFADKRRLTDSKKLSKEVLGFKT